MKISYAIEWILKNKYSISYKKGYKHYLNNNVEIVDINEINGITNVYGRVKDKANTYLTQIKIADNKLKLICNCEFAKQINSVKGHLACEHVIATALKINKNKTTTDDLNNIKIQLILEENFNKDYKFNAYLYLDGRGRVKISNKSELIYNVFNKEGRYYIGNTKYTKDNMKMFKILEDLEFKIHEEEIRKLLFTLVDNSISINVESMKYNCKVLRESLPLRFNIKKDNNRIKLQTIKSHIIALDNKKTVFIYNNNIYIPPINQCKAYSTLYNILDNKYYAYIKKNSLNKVIKILNSIGKLSISDEIKEDLSKQQNIELLIYKEKELIFCKFAISDKNKYLLSTSKVKNIEEILYKNKFTKKGQEYLFLGKDEDLYSLLTTDIYNYCDLIVSKELGKFSILSKDKIKSNIIEENNKIIFDLSFTDIENEEIKYAIDSYNEGKDFYKFRNNQFINFKDEYFSSLMKMLSFINYRGKSLELDLGYLDLIQSSIDNIEIIKKDQEEERKVNTPSGLKAKLRDYQKEGLNYLQNKKDKGLFGILADEMGLGKTVQTISFILNNKKDKSLIITPTSLVYNWEAEFKKFAPQLNVTCIYGGKSKRYKYLEDLSKYNVILTSYGTLNMDIDFYKDIEFDNLIIDEGQTIKNSKANVTKNVKSINSKTKFALTGTPFENNYLELWSIFDFLKPGYLFSENEFKNKFLHDEDNIRYLKMMIKPFILRRTKKQVLKELPDKIERIYYVKMTDEQRKYYNTKFKIFTKEAKTMNNSISILALLTKLRQIALDPSIINDDYNGGSGKINAAMEIINKCNVDNKKIIVFSQFTSLLDKLKEKLNKNNIKFYYLDGKTKSNTRVSLCDDFNNKNEVNVFLISLKGGGTGLNLTSANMVLHFDPWWNPQVENQATDRAHRIGQKNQVEVIKLIAKDTIEEKIQYLKEEKSNIFNNLMNYNEVSSISIMELLKIFNP